MRKPIQNKVVILHGFNGTILMRKLLFAAVFFTLCGMVGLVSYSCTDKKPAQDSLLADTLIGDSSDENAEEQIITDTPMPDAADELFDDFMFNFAANRKLQLERIVFPLPVNEPSGKKTVDKQHWKMEHFFMRQDYYTLIFDNIAQAEVAKDTSINHVIVEKIHLERKTVEQYIFDRKGGKWMMTEVNTTGFPSSSNASFLKFYSRFAVDSVFQIASINDPLRFSGPDPDNDFNNMDGILLPEQWPSFAPPLPSKMIYNIIYGRECHGSNQKVFIIRGIANGQEIELTFRRKGGKWKLVELHI